MTLLCNMQCLHCGSRAGKRRHNELSEGECLNIADQLIEMGNEHVTLIGGEILLVPHWYKIAKHFISAGVDANIITNAYKIGPQQIQDLRNSGIKDIGISIDGLSKTHDFIRNTRREPLSSASDHSFSGTKKRRLSLLRTPPVK